MKNILELLERAAYNCPEKTAFADEKASVSYAKLMNVSKRVGTAIINTNEKSKPVAIYLDKSIDVITAMLGIVYSGNIYTVIDTEMPKERIEKIFSTLCPAAIITDDRHLADAQELNDRVFLINEMKNESICDDALERIRSDQTDTDPLYILYTSGSTGIPKGTVIHHRNVLAYSEWIVNAFGINRDTVIGNQTPFYFSMSVTDIYATLRAAATLVIIPKICFSFPIKLTDFLNRHKVNMIYWVPSAYGVPVHLRLFETEKPAYLKTVLFAGEVMPVKYLNYWRRHLDDNTVFANLFGPTETTDICTYYTADRPFSDDETLPIGRHCDNCDVFIINSSGKEAAPGEEGELYVRGSFVSPGYYRNPEKTKEVFVQNPLNSAYPEICYKTGDLVRTNEHGEIEYISRKDFQIKRMGYRIELGEIETAAISLEEVKECACIFEKKSKKIVLFYSSANTDETALLKLLSKKLNGYMLPDELIRITLLPRNQNGKTDRKELEKRAKNGYHH